MIFELFYPHPRLPPFATYIFASSSALHRSPTITICSSLPINTRPPFLLTLTLTPSTLDPHLSPASPRHLHPSSFLARLSSPPWEDLSLEKTSHHSLSEQTRECDSGPTRRHLRIKEQRKINADKAQIEATATTTKEEMV